MIQSYLDSLLDEHDLCNIRLNIYTKDSLSWALLNLRIKWLQFQIVFLGSFVK